VKKKISHKLNNSIGRAAYKLLSVNYTSPRESVIEDYLNRNYID